MVFLSILGRGPVCGLEPSVGLKLLAGHTGIGYGTCSLGPRANWKGFLKIAEMTCPVSLYTAASTSERISFHIINRATGHRIRRHFVDSETGEPVETADQVKGFEVGKDEYVVLEPDELAAATPRGDKTLVVSAFIRCAEVDDVYFDKPYYLAPSDKAAEESFIVMREALRTKSVAAITRAVLFRRVRTLLVHAFGDGMIATTLKSDYEVRSAERAFADVPSLQIKREMLELAEHIIETKKGRFDPSKFDDRYEAAVADLVKAKLAGETIEVRRRPKPQKVVDLMAALRESARLGAKKAAAGAAPESRARRSSRAKAAAPRSKAG